MESNYTSKLKKLGVKHLILFMKFHEKYVRFGILFFFLQCIRFLDFKVMLFLIQSEVSSILERRSLLTVSQASNVTRRQDCVQNF